MPLFYFRTPPREVTANIRFQDENGFYSLDILLSAAWLRLTNLQPIADWPEWYVVVSRFIDYAREVAPGTFQDVHAWPTRHEASCAANYSFHFDTGEVTLTSIISAIDALDPAGPTMAQRLARLMIHIAERDQRRDRVARGILEQAGVLFEDK